MTVPNFPSSPTDGQTFTENGVTYVWDANGAEQGYWTATIPGGGVTNGPLVLNDIRVTADITVAATQNAQSIGPISIDDGVTVTIPDNRRWVIS